MATTFEKGISIQPRRRIDTIRLLLHDADVLDDLSDGWELLWGTLSREWLATNNEYYVSEWMLRFYSLELRNNPSPFRVAWLLISLMHSEKTHLMQILLGTGVDISHAIYNDLGFSPVHGIVAEGLPLAAIPSLKLMAESGADLHLAGRTDGFRSNGISPLETPTSVAMRRSQTFSRWQSFLKELMGYDPSEFAAKELEISPLVDAGWNRETLTSLLELKFEPAPLKQAICICGREVHQLYREEEQWWMELLNEVKNRVKPLAGDLEVKRASFEESENLCWICSEEGMARGGQWSPSAARPTTS
ncbi:hypothetical protein OIDMADRAFT_48803 [Oidiodendron maius Zn]|uniref:Uncharacterized protein n=1 Tax=Oidiodendron maius (strain Zn) TaxID=913774 RepID=A0A0C3I3J7_OIDMZ|nr:hypothetical protein OIDMADRAFT_48803 [Oidiodendron maius Zn]